MSLSLVPGTGLATTALHHLCSQLGVPVSWLPDEEPVLEELELSDVVLGATVVQVEEYEAEVAVTCSNPEVADSSMPREEQATAAQFPYSLSKATPNAPFAQHQASAGCELLYCQILKPLFSPSRPSGHFEGSSQL